jgi:V/A-type H+-transporting ATPase subunit I
MIIAMSRVRVMGPRDLLPEVLRTLQDVGTMHLTAPDGGGGTDTILGASALTLREAREEKQLRRALADVEFVLDELRPGTGALTAAPYPGLPALARLAGRLRRHTEKLGGRATSLEEERALILKYQHFFSAFRAMLESEARWPNAVAYHVLLKGGDAALLARLRSSLASIIGDEFELYTHTLPTGEIAVLIVVSSQAAGRVERLLSEAHVQEIPVPAQYGGGSLSVAIPLMLSRLGEIPRGLAALKEERDDLARRHGGTLRRARGKLRDRLAELQALPLTGITPRAFVLEGWVPSDGTPGLREALEMRFGGAVIVSEMSREEWASEDAPVVLRNPRLLRPFESIIALMPLPRYGTIDPTPFVAVFFPAFFGMMVGDIGYGLLLGIIAGVLHRKSRPDTLLRQVSEIGGACAVFATIAGILFGEFLGDLGHRVFGLRPVLFNREEALMPFLILAVTLGAVHILVGLVLGVISNIHRHPRAALGRGVSALMLLMIAAALLATFGVLPGSFFTPAVVGLLVAFPVLIIAEGLVAPIELLSTVGNILSYARIMALGVASVMLAVVANDMIGAFGSVAVGLVFALLFHIVNFAIAIFSPTIHSLRLHYVEFFGKFYSPGGVRYQPFGRWTHEPTRARN